MAEAITLNIPIPKTTNEYKPHSLVIRVYPVASIDIIIINNLGEQERFQYPTAVGASNFDTHDRVAVMINTLNTANLSTRSLWRRIFDRLLADFPDKFTGGGVVV